MAKIYPRNVAQQKLIASGFEQSTFLRTKVRGVWGRRKPVFLEIQGDSEDGEFPHRLTRIDFRSIRRMRILIFGNRMIFGAVGGFTGDFYRRGRNSGIARPNCYNEEKRLQITPNYARGDWESELTIAILRSRR